MPEKVRSLCRACGQSPAHLVRGIGSVRPQHRCPGGQRVRARVRRAWEGVCVETVGPSSSIFPKRRRWA